MKKKLIIGLLIASAIAGVVFLFYRKGLQNKVMELYDLTEYQVAQKSLSDLRKMIAEWKKTQNQGGA